MQRQASATPCTRAPANSTGTRPAGCRTEAHSVQCAHGMPSGVLRPCRFRLTLARSPQPSNLTRQPGNFPGAQILTARGRPQRRIRAQVSSARAGSGLQYHLSGYEEQGELVRARRGQEFQLRPPGSSVGASAEGTRKGEAEGRKGERRKRREAGSAGALA